MPTYTSTTFLEDAGTSNTLEELLNTLKLNQLQRLRSAAQGISILLDLGYDISQQENTTRTQLAPSTRSIIHTVPLPRNMHPERNKSRRTLRIKAILKQIKTLDLHTELYYMDASLREGTRVTVVVERNN